MFIIRGTGRGKENTYDWVKSFFTDLFFSAESAPQFFFSSLGRKKISWIHPSWPSSWSLGKGIFWKIRRQWQHKKGRRNTPVFTAVDGHFCCFVSSSVSYSTCRVSGWLSSSINFTWTCRSCSVKKVTPMFDFFFSLSFLDCNFWMLQKHSDSTYPYGQHTPKHRMIQ